jgi:hypothetical protein
MRRSRLPFAAMVILAGTSQLDAQAANGTPSDPKVRAEEFAQQFAVPASPAFKLVDVATSSILRPTSFQQLATTFGSLGLTSGDFQLPKELGIELAPFFLSRARTLALQDYRRNALLYRLRVSAATKRRDDAAGSTDLAFGLRIAPYDATDPRSSRQLIERVTQETDRIVAICAREVSGPPRPTDKVGVVKTCADPRNREEGLVAALAEAGLSQARRDTLTAELQALRAHKEIVQAEIDSINERVETLRDTWSDSAWNKSGFELAVAYAARTIDSVGNGPEFRKASGWMSGALPVGSWGQLVIGGTGSLERDSVTSKRDMRWDLGTALYVGANKYKGFVELQTSFKDGKSGIVADAGAEIFIVTGVWAHATAGWTRDPGETKARLVTRFNIRTKLPFQLPKIALPGSTPAS